MVSQTELITSHNRILSELKSIESIVWIKFWFLKWEDREKEEINICGMPGAVKSLEPELLTSTQ